MVEALGTSKDLVTYLPADYGMVWTDYILKYPKIAFVQKKVDLRYVVCLAVRCELL